MENTLFNEITIKRLVEGTKLTAKQKKASQEWLNLMDKGELIKEKEGYLKFYDIILKELLGYDNIKHEKEGVEFSYEKDGKSIIRIEAKGMDTPNLFSPQKRAKEESPAEQVWRYMNKFATPYGIVTNYRLFVLFKYDVGNTKYYLFDFEDIRRNPNELKEFVAIFSKESIDNGFVDKLHKESTIEEREFTKEFYKLYHETRLMLIREFENNTDISKDASVHFAQIFLNRLMFVFFAEDTGKIEKKVIENRILKTLESTHLFSSNSNNISNVLVGLFRDLDKGSDFPTRLFGFNGGLFKHPIPDRIHFRDFRDSKFFKDIYQHSKLKGKTLELNEKEREIFEKYKNKLNPIIENVLLMASFDFNTEVNVNILGHIFEQSISDIEDLKKNKTSRRKKEGIFYTPEYITDYICRNTIIPYLSEKGTTKIYDLIKEYANNIEDLERKFKEMKILDPACGSGAFLIKATDIILEIFKAIQEFKQQEGEYQAQRGLKRKSNNKGQLVLTKWNEEDEAREIIEKNIFGVDINEESVEITKLSLFLKMARKNRKLTDLSNNIKQGNSLIDDENIAGRLAFNWNEEFKEIMEKGGFDIVIGNPPYVRADTEDVDFIKQRKYLDNSKDYETLYEKWDLMVPFYERSLKLLKDGGYHSFIVSNAISTSKYAFKLQKWIIENMNLLSIDYFDKINVFENVGVIPLITIIKKSKSKNKVIKIIHKNKFENKIKQTVKFNLEDKDKEIKVFKKNYSENVIKSDSELFGDICYMSVGMVINADEKTNKGAFTKDDLISSEKNKINSKEFVEGKDLDFYRFKNIKYLEWNTKRVPSQLRRQTFKELYEGQKIMRGRVTPATYDDIGIICNDGVLVFKRFIDLKDTNNKSIKGSIKKNNSKDRSELEALSSKFDIKYLLALINSKYAFYYLNNIRRHRLKNYFYPDDFRKLPIPKISPSEQKPFIEKADSMLKLNKDFYDKKNKFFNRIKKSFSLEKINKKLDRFYDLEFNDFIKEVEKQTKKKISLKEQDEWEDYFNDYKKELLKLKEQIEKTDNEINDIVYDLYEITEKEKQIIESS